MSTAALAGANRWWKVKRLGVTAAAAATVMLGGAGAVYAADLVTMPTKAVYKAPPDAACTSIVDFFTTACQLTAYGVRIYGTIDIGGTYQTNGAPLDKFFPTGASYFIQKMNRQSMFGWGPNGLSQSNIGIQITEPLGGGWKFVGQLDAGFDPVTGEFANGPGSLVDNFGKATAFQTTSADSGRNGAFYNGQGFAGFSNDTWGTLTFGRQNSLTLDGVNSYDPMGGAYAFSPIGFSGKVPGGGNTEDTRYNTSVRYRVNFANFRFGAIAEFGGIDSGNGAEQAFETSVGGDFHVGPGLLSVDVIGGFMKDAVNLGLTSVGGGTNNALKATISDNTNVMVLAKYTINKLKLSAGYEWVHYDAASDFGNFVNNVTVMDGANTGFNPVTQFGNQASQFFQVFWGGARYSITDSVDIAAAYYRYNQNDAAGAPASCSANPVSNSACHGFMNAASVMLDWKFAPKWDTYIGTFYSETNGGMNNGFLAHSNLATTAGVRFRF
jgi:predicted porin